MRIATSLSAELSELPCNNSTGCTRARYLDEEARRLQKLQVPNALHLLHADIVNCYTALRPSGQRLGLPDLLPGRVIGQALSTHVQLV